MIEIIAEMRSLLLCIKSAMYLFHEGSKNFSERKKSLPQNLVKPVERKQIKESPLIGRNEKLEIIANHYFGISIIALSIKDVSDLKDEIDEWSKELDSRQPPSCVLSQYNKTNLSSLLLIQTT